MRSPRTLLARSCALLALPALAALPACGGGSGSAASSGDGSPVTLRLGYFPNITHATALVGVEKATFAQRLGPDRLETKVFNAGPAAVEALFSGALDATYIGPNPAINAFVKSKGEAVRIVAGATSGGAALVVRPDIRSAADLRGKKVASPQLGGTQDVALRAWLKSNGLATNATGGGDVTVLPQENAQTLETFRSGAVAGAWVPEPWATRLVLEGGGTVLVDEASLWPGGRFVTTHLVVRTEFLRKHPATVRRLLEGHAEATAFVNANAAEAQALANQGIEKATGKKLGAEVIASAWSRLAFTNDPVASSLRTSAEHATDLGLLEKVDLDGIYDLALLGEVLAARNEPAVDAP
ncbi:MAG TPA: ABC transporter substrate-binding protein [Acidimicrobiales bacterium]|jgi:NitT/TauT family transport system substrate-binding protein